jgi:ABC-type phosphate transport system permease subunit
MTNFLININFLAVLVACIIHIISGLIWFHPKLFGKEWSNLTGKEMKPDVKWIFPMIVGHFLMVLVLLIFIKLLGVNDGVGGLFFGLLAWIGFIVPMEIGELVWEKIPFKLFLLRVGNQFIGLGIAGFILGIWQ